MLRDHTGYGRQFVGSHSIASGFKTGTVTSNFFGSGFIPIQERPTINYLHSLEAIDQIETIITIVPCATSFEHISRAFAFAN